jgi:hypothetical protein
MRRSVLAVLLLAAAAASSRAQDLPEPSYADKPASWWVQEFVAGDIPSAAGAVLQRMGDAAAPAIVAALASARESDARCRLLGLLERVSKLPDPVVPALRSSLTSSNLKEQVSALRVAARAGKAAGPLAGEIAALLASRDAGVRREAADTLGALTDAALPQVPALVARIGNDDDDTTLACADALGRIGPPAGAAVPRLLLFSAARAPQVPLLRALCSIAPDDARVGDEIVRAVETGGPDARSAALQFLREPRTAGTAYLSAAERLSTSKDAAVRAAVARGLGPAARGRAEVPEALFALLRDDDTVVVAEAARALKTCGPADHSIAPRVADAWRVTRFPNAMSELMLALRPQSGPALIEAALSDRTDLRQAAWHVMARCEDTGFAADADQLTRMFLDARVDLPQRANLLSFLVGRGRLPPATETEVCAAVVARGEPSLAVRAMPSLASDASHRDTLIAAAVRLEPEVRAAAIGALGCLCASFPDVSAACIRGLDDAEPIVRDAALRSLRRGETRLWTIDSAARELFAARLPALIRAGLEERRAAIDILGQFPDAARPAEPLVALLAYDDSVVSALILLRRAPADLPEFLKPLLSGDDPVLAARAVRAGGGRKIDDGLVAKLGTWIESPDARVAREAASALAELPPEKISRLGGALIRAAKAGVDGVASPACHALDRIAGSEPAARDALLAVADDPENSAQLAVTQFLPSLGAPGIARLVALLDHPARDARRDACAIIASSGRGQGTEYAAAIPSLERIALGDDLEMARLAKQALEVVRK